jgi:hypothetical protein
MQGFFSLLSRQWDVGYRKTANVADDGGKYLVNVCIYLLPKLFLTVMHVARSGQNYG